MTLGWRVRPAALLLALWITGTDEARAQGRPVAVEGTVGWAGFVDDATIHHGVFGGGARISLSPRISVGPEIAYMVGPDDDRVYVGADVRIGWELHLRSTAHVGVTWPGR